MTPELPLVCAITVAILVIAAGCYDLRWRRIPNWLTFSGAAVAVILNTSIFGLQGLRIAGTGLILGGGVYFVLYVLRGMGAGDVKLMAAIGGFVGPASWFRIFIASAIAGAVLAIIVSVLKKRLRRTFWNVAFMLSSLMSLRAPYLSNKELDVRDSQGVRMPHGAVIALATLVVLIAQWASA